jgi:hypothetical protein
MAILTLSQLKKFAGFEGISDEEGTSIINTLYQFSLLAYQFFHCSKNYTNEQF